MIYCGDLFDVLPALEADSIDACVTDPPYDLTQNKPGGSGARAGGFMGKRWDGEGVAFRVDTWRGVFRALKPGAHLVAFGGPRTFHRMTCAIEDAGFEIRDCLSWLYGQGFPKSLDVGNGRGTALKPAWEPIILARKPFKGSVAANVLAHGTGALNVDACRRISGDPTEGRWPSNVLLDEEAAGMLDQQSGVSRDTPHRRAVAGTPKFSGKYNNGETYENAADQFGGYGDSGGASRFFYVAKPSREERDSGLYGALEKKRIYGGGITSSDHPETASGGGDRLARNIHPTVKPVELMRWLVKLVTPIGGSVLDPFMGSGTTGMACAYEFRPFVGIEREAEYVAIAESRIAACVPLFREQSA